MKNSRGLLAVLSVISIAAIALGIFTYVHRAVSEQVYAYNCGIVDYKPVSILKSCGDARVGVVDLQWDTWGADGATGVGQYWINPCKPDCAQGKLQYADVKVKLSASVVDKGKKVLSQIELITADGKKLPLHPTASDSWILESKPLP